MRVTASPESTRPATRRALRERARTRATRESARDGADTNAAVDDAHPPQEAAARDTDAVDVDDAVNEAEPQFLRDPDPDPAPADPDPAPADPDPAPSDGAALGDDEPVRVWADDAHPTTALAWLQAEQLTAPDEALHHTPAALFEGARLTPGWRRPRVLIPLGFLTALAGAYVATTLLWPLHAVEPSITVTEVAIAPAPPATAPAPAQGSAAVAVQGIPAASSSIERAEIASITKVASVLMVLDEMPLELGEEGPRFEFTSADARDFWTYRRSNQSSLDVPVGGSLTEYQMLQGILLGSANNYIDRLSNEIWGSDRAFARAAETWLRKHGVTGMTLVSPSGFHSDNVATPEAVVQLGQIAMRNPVFAEIVGTRSAEIPGVGTVTNTNRMLEDAGVVGVKTGTLTHWNLLTAKDVTVGDTTVRLFAAVLGQENNADRLAITRELFADVEADLAAQPVSLPKGTVVGKVSTEWGESAEVVTDADARVVLWNNATAKATPMLDLESKTAAGAKVGTVTVQGPVDIAKTSVSLASEIPAPSAWWRLTHPLELFGLDAR